MSGTISNSGTATAGTRNPAETPFASDSVFNLPLGSDAQWEANGQLSGADLYVNTTVSGYTENIYTGTASDPVVTVTDPGNLDGTPATYQVHIPANAEPAAGGDSTFTVDDTTTGTWYSFGGFNWTGSNTATVAQADAEPDTGSGLTQSSGDFDEGVGTLTQSDLSAGTIDHMLRIEIPTSMAESYTNSPYQLAPFAWPQTQEDGFAINGDGGTPYSGTIPYGVTIGIPAGTPEPADVAANPGANMLWQALQDHGAMVRDTTSGSGNTVVFQADQNVNPSDPLILGMDQYGSEIMAATQILTNQGPNSVNGGGTPIVPLDPPVSDASSSSDSSSDTATITSDTLSSGSSGTTGSSGISFVATPDASSTTDISSGTSGSSVGTDITSSTDTSSSGSLGATTSTSDFTTPASTDPSTSTDPTSGSGGSFTTYQGNHHAAYLAAHQG
jgi:hypothetical protein